MSEIIQLLSFKMTRLNIDQNPFEVCASDRNATQETSLDIRDRNDDPNRFLIILRVHGTCGARKGKPLPSYDAIGVAEFRTPPDLEREKKAALVAFNGGAILYGLIRGQVSLVTGSFPSGSILLPTLDWQKTLKEIADKKVAGTAQQTGCATPKEETDTPKKIPKKDQKPGQKKPLSQKAK